MGGIRSVRLIVGSSPTLPPIFSYTRKREDLRTGRWEVRLDYPSHGKNYLNLMHGGDSSRSETAPRGQVNNSIGKGEIRHH